MCTFNYFLSSWGILGNRMNYSRMKEVISTSTTCCAPRQERSKVHINNTTHSAAFAASTKEQCEFSEHIESDFCIRSTCSVRGRVAFTMAVRKSPLYPLRELSGWTRISISGRARQERWVSRPLNLKTVSIQSELTVSYIILWYSYFNGAHHG